MQSTELVVPTAVIVTFYFLYLGILLKSMILLHMFYTYEALEKLFS